MTEYKVVYAFDWWFMCEWETTELMCAERNFDSRDSRKKSKKATPPASDLYSRQKKYTIH